MEASHPVLAVTGLAREARIAAGRGVITIGAGGNPVRLRALLNEQPPACRAVVSFGIAGGLDPALSPGAVVIATGVVSGAERWPADPDILRLWAERLADSHADAVLADLAGVDAPLLGPAEKSALRATSEAAAVDMESHVAAGFAAARGVPFAAIRVVCDPAERALPPLVAEALRPDGGVDLPAILRNLARRPGQVAALPRLARDASAAFAALGRVGAALGPGLGLGGLGVGKPLGHVL